MEEYLFILILTTQPASMDVQADLSLHYFGYHSPPFLAIDANEK